MNCCIDHSHGEASAYFDTLRTEDGIFDGWVCSDCADARVQRNVEGTFTGTGATIVPNLYGVDSEGKRSAGCEPWHHRPPRPWNGRQVSLLEGVMVNGELLYQPPPPIDVSGFPPGQSKPFVTRLKAISEEAAARILLDQELGKVTGAEVSKALGVSPRKARKLVTARNRRAG